MGFRFRRTVRLLPGIRLNFSRSGVSTSFGGQGATLNVSRQGVRSTVGLPGTGLSYSKFYKDGGDTSARATSVGSVGCVVIAVGAVGVLILARCSGSAPLQTVAPIVSGSPAVKHNSEAFVAADMLNCRTSGNATSQIIRRYKRGDRLVIAQRELGWVRVDDNPECWVKANYLADTPSLLGP